MHLRAAACLLLTACASWDERHEDDEQDKAPPAAATSVSFAQALELGQSHAGPGTPWHVELENEDEGVVWSVDVAQGSRTRNVVLDAADGRVLGNEIEDEDQSAAVAACKIKLWDAVQTALSRHAGRPVDAELALEAGKPVITVKVLGDTLVSVRIDGVTGVMLAAADTAFADTFAEAGGEWTSTGRNPYLVLEPGWQLVLEGEEDDEDVRLTITVLDETRDVAGVQTRIVEEREEADGELVEISRNFMAISRLSGAVGYFGEEVDIYDDGELVKHEGAWLAGRDGARFGLLLPGKAEIGARFHQEVAPGVALDRAEIVGMSETLDTPAGRFTGCLKVRESSALEKGSETKLHAPGIGLVQEESLRLVKYGPSGS